MKTEIGWSKQAKAVILHEIQHAIQEIENFASGSNTSNKRYDYVAGEIEARDTANRANLTAEERKNTRPDIDRTDVVFAEGSDLSFEVNENFEQSLDDWFNSTTTEERIKDGGRILLGTTSRVLKSIGVKDYSLYFGKSKIQKILNFHKDITPEIIKKAVYLLDEPIIVLQSKTSKNSIVLFGEVFTESKKPVMLSLLLNPQNKSGEILDFAIVTSAYSRRKNNVQNLINESEIYYVNENKNRTDKWLSALGLQLPSAIIKYGSINRISENSENVKENSEKTEISNKNEAFRYQTRDTSFAREIKKNNESTVAVKDIEEAIEEIRNIYEDYSLTVDERRTSLKKAPPKRNIIKLRKVIEFITGSVIFLKNF